MALGAELKTVELYLQNTKEALESILLKDCTADLKVHIYGPASEQRTGSIIDFDGSLLKEFDDVPDMPHPFAMFRSGKRKSEPPKPTHEIELQIKADMLVVFLSHMYRRFQLRKIELEEAIKNESATT